MAPPDLTTSSVRRIQYREEFELEKREKSQGLISARDGSSISASWFVSDRTQFLHPGSCHMDLSYRSGP